MYQMKRIGMVFMGLCALASFELSAQTAGTGSTAGTGTGTGLNVQSPPMTMNVPGALPAGFRGGNTDDGPVNILEDGNYKIEEHSVLYNDTTSGMGQTAQGTKFSTPPTINWTTEKENADGTTQGLGSNNNNQASLENNTFKDPGTYRIHNGGARQVSGGAQDTSGTGTSAGAGTGTTAGAGTGTTAGTGTGAAAGAGAEAASQRVTSNQTLTVIAHDCTAPSIWAVIQEGAGSTNLAADEQRLKEELKTQMLETKGDFSPESELSGSLKEASLLAMSEMPKNQPPETKTAAVFIKGPLFDETGKKIAQPAPGVAMTVRDQEKQTRQAKIGQEQVKGVFVRRNIPFLAAAQMTDNGAYNRDGATCKIINKATGQEVEKADGAFLFRVANYPRDTFKDQPEYEFVTEGSDNAGNHSEVRVPLYVVNTQASFEGGKSE